MGRGGRVSKPYDAAGKVLLELDPAGWLSLLGATRPADRVRVVDADLSAVSLASDKVVRVDDPDPWLMHLEFQAGHDLGLLPRLFAYQGLLHDRHRLPVARVVVLLSAAADSPRYTGEYAVAPPLGRPTQVRYTVVRVWQVPVADLLAGPPVFLPLAPLADLGPGGLPALQRPLTDRLAAVPDRRMMDQLAVCLATLLPLRFRDIDAQTLFPGMHFIRGYYDHPGVKGFVEMLKREGLAEGRAEGEAIGRREVLLAVGRERFGEPPAAVVAAVRAITDLNRLTTLVVRVLTISGWDELLADPPGPPPG
jgi:hypothetical protein